MGQESVHIIKHAAVDMQYNAATDGFALQKEVQDWFDDFVARLDKQFNDIVMPDEIISIDLLELSIDCSSKHWKEDATRQLLFQVLDKIMLLHSGSVATKTYKKVTLAKHLEDEFIFYLQHGYLSWKASLMPAREWKQKVNGFFNKEDKAFAEKLLSEIKNNRNVIARLATSVPATLLLRVLSALFSNNTSYQTMAHDFTLLHQTIQSKKAGESSLMISFLNIISQWPEQQYVEYAVRNLLNSFIVEQVFSKKEIKSILFQSKIFLHQQEIIAGNLEKENTTKTGNKKVITTRTIEREVNNQTAQTVSETSAVSETDGIFISNAGLVIVAAFLPALFNKLQFYDGATIQNHTNAVCLLHYLATGEQPTDELELVLPKILCGLAPEMFIDVKAFHVQKKWKNEVEDVVKSAIEYWNAVGNTSAAGLRESFLKRKGKLSHDGSVWHLQVEQQPYDLLLQHLPWNISMIQLPWMKQMLQTEWIY
jgi:hypothetical protein